MLQAHFEWTFLLQIREFRSNSENTSRDFRVIVLGLSHDSRETFIRVSHDIPTNVAYFHLDSYDSHDRDIRESVPQRSYKCRLDLFSHQIVARCSHVFSRLLRDCRTTLAQHSYECHKNFALYIRQNLVATGSPHLHEMSHNRCTTVA